MKNVEVWSNVCDPNEIPRIKTILLRWAIDEHVELALFSDGSMGSIDYAIKRWELHNEPSDEYRDVVYQIRRAYADICVNPHCGNVRIKSINVYGEIVVQVLFYMDRYLAHVNVAKMNSYDWNNIIPYLP